MQQGQPPQQAQQGLGSMMPAQMADGGRPGYFLGKLVKKNYKTD